MGLADRVRRKAGGAVTEGLLRGLASAGRLHPLARPEAHDVEVLRDIPYADTGSRDHLLDVYRPVGAEGRPAVLYLHGGGFRILSKDTHWLMGLAFARQGYTVFNANYRLAPAHPYPAAVQDAALAYRWVVANAERFGGDVSRLIVAGESAGANLTLGLSVAACYERTEPHAREVFDTGVAPVAAVPACGLLQVTDPQRFFRRKRIPGVVADRMTDVVDAYLRGADVAHGYDLADPLVVLERGEAPARPLPPMFAPVGTADPILDDTRRLARALDRLGVEHEARYYPGEIHAFHAFVFRDGARRCWQEKFAFLERVVPAAPR